MAAHPQYPTLEVVTSGSAKPGAFYAPRPGDRLSTIAAKAYGNGKLTNTLRINKSPWNVANCIYRTDSTSCASKKVSSNLATLQKTWSKGAWIALCQADKNATALQLGTAFQVIWIPTAAGQEPGDLAPVKVTLPVVPPAAPTPPVSAAPSPYAPIAPTTPGPVVVDPGEPAPVEPPTEQKAGLPWWMGLILGTVLIGGVVVIAKDDKKKRKGR